MPRIFAIFSLLSFVLVSCSNSVGSPEFRRQRAAELSLQMQNLSPKVDKKEADAISTALIETAAANKKKYGIIFHRWLHNAMINGGMRERGLCYHWADDMYDVIKKENPKTLAFCKVVGYNGELYREHHGVSLYAKGGSWEDGIIIDGWRKTGRLHFSPLKSDIYPWKFEMW